MSIVLTVKPKNSPEINCPVSTESFFERCWIKIAKKNNLHLILSMQSGYSFDQFSIKQLLEELKKMANSIPTEELETEDFIFLKERLDYIANQITQILIQEGESITGYVG